MFINQVAVPMEDKEISKSDGKVASPPVEDQTPVEEKSWEDKEDLLDEGTSQSNQKGDMFCLKCSFYL